MLKHVFLIQAHKMPDLLIRILKRLESSNHYFIINIDKKSRFKKDFYREIENVHNVIEVTNFSVAHGGLTQITTTLYQMKFCINYSIKFDYYHSISGQDYPLVSNQEFDTIFEQRSPNSYIQIDSSEELAVWRKTKYPKRLDHYYLHDAIQNKFLHRIKVFSILNHIAMLIPRDRFKLLNPIWGGGTGFH